MKPAKLLPLSIQPTAQGRDAPPRRRRRFRLLLSSVLLLAAFQYSRVILDIAYGDASNATAVSIPLHAADSLDKCALLDVQPGPPPDFHTRLQSDRFVGGTKPTLITNATIWTGGNNGFEVVHGDILLDRGLIKRIFTGLDVESYNDLYSDQSLDRIDAQGKWVSPGIVDLHSHLGLDSVPQLRGASDTNSRKGPVLPWLRALDAINTHDEAYRLSASGGVTTALVLPGSANAIGGQAAVIKLRHTAERSPTSMLLENPYETNTTEYDPKTYFRYRQMKQACGENPDRVYSGTRMDTAWAFRQAYEKARQIKQAQDDYCAKATRGDWAGLGAFPDELQWEALVDVLRGRVKIHTHCYETVDLDDLVRISNEFKFPIAAFHHAHETYLIPGTLKSAYGRPPAAAIFATHARYKREAYRGSEFAPRILAENGIQVIMKSDHPVLDSRFLLWEAQQAYYHGLPHNLALAAVTTTPANVLGKDHRIGYVKEGYDADVVLWDSHPLALGATPQQVWIDGIPQLAHPHALTKPAALQHRPAVPDFSKEAEEALRHDGLPPLEPATSVRGTVVFANVSSVFVRAESGAGVRNIVGSSADGAPLWAVVRAGRLVCVDTPRSACVRRAVSADSDSGDGDVVHVDLQGGALSPGLTTFGSALGLEEIQGEASTKDGAAPDALTESVPGLVGGSDALVRAVDGLQFGTRNALVAYRAGVTTGVVPPASGGFVKGLSTAFSTGARHKLEEGALVQADSAVHVSIHPGRSASVSTQIGALRRLLLNQTEGELGRWFEEIRQGEAPLVVDVESADVMATLVALKTEVEAAHAPGAPLKFTFTGASEAHLLARELGQAGIGVLFTQPRPFPKTWESRRILPGPPLSAKSAVAVLLEHGVTVGLGTPDGDKARNTRFDAAWAALESGGTISKEEAIALVSTNVETLLGVRREADDEELVATSGGDLLEYSKVVSVISPRRGVVDIF